MTYLGEPLSFWIDLLVKLAPVLITLIIGSLGAYIAFQQHKTNRDKLRLDLFAKRLEAYEKLQEYFAFVLRDGTAKDETLPVLRQAIYKSQFLFGPEIQKYLKDLWISGVNMRTLSNKMDPERGGSGLPVGEERNRVSDEHHKLVLWHSGEMDNVQGRYAKYLQFGHVKS